MARPKKTGNNTDRQRTAQRPADTLEKAAVVGAIWLFGAISLGALILAFILYSPALTGPFLFDDFGSRFTCPPSPTTGSARGLPVSGRCSCSRTGLIFKCPDESRRRIMRSIFCCTLRIPFSYSFSFHAFFDSGLLSIPKGAPSPRRLPRARPCPPPPNRSSHLSPLALCRRFQRGRSVFNSINVAAVFAPEKMYGCSGSVAFNCVPKFQFAAATRTSMAS